MKSNICGEPTANPIVRSPSQFHSPVLRISLVTSFLSPSHTGSLPLSHFFLRPALSLSPTLFFRSFYPPAPFSGRMPPSYPEYIIRVFAPTVYLS